MDEQKELIGSHEAACILRLNYQAFYKRYIRGMLPFEPVDRMGGQYIWRRSAVERYARAGIAHTHRV